MYVEYLGFNMTSKLILFIYPHNSIYDIYYICSCSIVVFHPLKHFCKKIKLINITPYYKTCIKHDLPQEGVISSNTSALSLTDLPLHRWSRLSGQQGPVQGPAGVRGEPRAPRRLHPAEEPGLQRQRDLHLRRQEPPGHRGPALQRPPAGL